MIGPTTQVEVWIASRLQRPDLFAGVTTADERRERVRRVILDRDMAEAIAGKRAGQSCETWGELYRRVYGRDLIAQEDAA